MWLVYVGYAVMNAIAWWIASPQEFGDTYRYFGSTLFDIQNPGITPVLLYTTVGSPEAITAIQVGLQTLAFVWLAIEVRASIASRRLGTVMAILVLLLSLTAPLWSWTALLGSESLTIAATVAWMAAVLRVLRRSSWGSVVLCGAAVLAMIVTRPMTAGVACAVIACLAVTRWRTARVPMLALGVTTLAAAAYGAARLSALSSEPTFRGRYALSNFIDKGPSFRTYALERMPACEPLVAAVNGPAPWQDGWQFQGSLISTCPETYLWMRSDATASQSWVLAMPHEAWANFVGIARDLGFVRYAPSGAFPDLPWQEAPTVLLAVAALAIGAVLTVVLARLRWNRSALASSVVVAVAVVVTGLVVWSADGIEHSRHLQPFTSLLPMAALLVVPIGFARARRADVAPAPGRAVGAPASM